MLLKDGEFKPLRKSLQDAGYPLVLQPSQTIVLVRPEQYLDTVNSLEGHSLKPYKVLISESEEYLMEEVLSRMSSKRRPRENRQDREELDLSIKYIKRRTFICEAPLMLIAGTVAQSTIEAVRSASTSSASANYFTHARGGNPRRRVSDWAD